LFQTLPLRKARGSFKVYLNLMLMGLAVDGLLQCVVSDMTVFYLKGVAMNLRFIWTYGTMKFCLIRFRRKENRRSYDLFAKYG